jgi:hypothetical protein
MPYFVVMFNDLKYQVTNLFVDIGEIINHPLDRDKNVAGLNLPQYI